MTDHTPPLGPLPEQFEKAMTEFGIACAYGRHSARLESGRALMDAATAYALQERAAERVRFEPVAWQQRYLCPDEGPSIWQHCCDSDAEILKRRTDYELRRVYAQRAEPGKDAA